MEVDREVKIDGLIVALMIIYGFLIVGSSPILAAAAWIVAGALLLRHTFEPFGEFVEEHQLAFMTALLIILTAGFLLSN